MNGVGRYVKKPVTIEAIKFTRGHEHLVEEFIDQKLEMIEDCEGLIQEIKIPSLDGELTAILGDYIIRSIKGEYYPCRPDIFNLMYDEEVIISPYEQCKTCDLIKITEDK